MKLSQASALRPESGSESDMLETNLTKGSHHILVQRFEYKKKLMLMLMLKLMLMLMLILMTMLMLMLMLTIMTMWMMVMVMMILMMVMVLVVSSARQRGECGAILGGARPKFEN